MYQRRRRWRRSRLGALSLAVALVGATGACTSGEQPTADPSRTPSTPSASPSPSRSDAPVTLRFGVYGSSSEIAAYRRVARVYEQEKPNVTVEVQATSDESRAWQRLGRQFDAGSSPDVFLADSNRVADLVAEQRVRPVDELLEARKVQFGDKYERLGLEAFAANQSLQCMPNDVSPSVVFYNKRLLDLTTSVQPGQTVPTPETDGWTWQQFALAAQSVSQGGVQGVYLPPELTTLAPLVRSAGADIVDDVQRPTTLTLADPTARAALDRVLSLARDPRINPTPAQLRRQDATTRFENGRLAMMIGTRALVPRLREKPGLTFDVYPLPSLGQFQTIADVSGYCISRASEHVEQAADFLAFAVGDRAAKITARSGGIVPANLTALQSPAFEQLDQFPLNTNVFSNVIRRAETMPNPRAWPTLVDRTRPLLRALFYDTVFDLDSQLAQLDAVSASVLAAPTASASPSG